MQSDENDELQGIAISHVDDIEGGIRPTWQRRALAKTRKRLDFSQWNEKELNP